MSTHDEANKLLHALGIDATDVQPVGAGAWSRAYGFRTAEGEFVLRIGEQLDDFLKDRLAHRYRTPAMNVPEVVHVGSATDGYYAISTRVPGTPLEQCTPDEWTALVPSVVAVLSDLRDATPAGPGFGLWDGSGAAPHATWRDYLLAVADDPPGDRIHGWTQRLSARDDVARTFAHYLERLDRVAVDDVPRSVVHGDLINRNVHVDGATVTGVFDWGSSAYGDHLYDLAWFQFWSPWHPHIALDPLSQLDHREDQRLLACLLHIGLGHLAYNAYIEDWAALDDVLRRMRDVAS